VQRDAVVRKRRHDRDLARREFRDERMLFVDLRVAPAPGPVEFDDDGRRIVAPDLVDAVLVAAERLQTPVAAITDAVERVEDDVRCER